MKPDHRCDYCRGLFMPCHDGCAPVPTHKLMRKDFDSDTCVAEQEAYGMGMIDQESGHNRPSTMPSELRGAYIDGYRDAEG